MEINAYLTKRDISDYPRFPRKPYKSHAEKVAELDKAVANGTMTAEEAEWEYQDLMHAGMSSFLGVYGW